MRGGNSILEAGIHQKAEEKQISAWTLSQQSKGKEQEWHSMQYFRGYLQIKIKDSLKVIHLEFSNILMLISYV